MQSYLAGAQTKSFFSSRPALGSVQEMMSLARSFRRRSHWSSIKQGELLIDVVVVVVVDVVVLVVVLVVIDENCCLKGPCCCCCDRCC
jgi:hypothetical protein